jgi:allantoinase
MDNRLYDYSPIVSRSKIAWPNGARLAFYIGLNIEHFEVDKPGTSIFGPLQVLGPIHLITDGAITACASASGG